MDETTLCLVSILCDRAGAEQEFYLLSEALNRIQASGATGMRVNGVKDQE